MVTSKGKPWDDVVEACSALIAVPSENPGGSESGVADLVRDALSGTGFALELVEAAPGRTNVIARLSRGSSGRKIIVQGHLDTKPAGSLGGSAGWSTSPWQPTVRDGLLYGLGACDTKGGVAAELVALRQLARRRDWTGEIVFQGVADEEDGSALGAQYLLELGELAADAAIVAEPTSCRPSVAQLGNAWASVTVTGLAAHAGTPERGIDGVRAALEFIRRVDAQVAVMPTHHAFESHPRLNVGEIRGGGHPGTLPGQCRLLCDIRVLPGQRHAEVFSVYEAVAAEMTAEDPRIDVNVERYMGGGCESHEVDEEHALVQCFDETIGGSQRCWFFGGSDARYFARAGTPSIVYGPGSLEQAHAPNEFVPLEQLERAAVTIERVVLRYLGT